MSAGHEWSLWMRGRVDAHGTRPPGRHRLCLRCGETSNEETPLDLGCDGGAARAAAFRSWLTRWADADRLEIDAIRIAAGMGRS